MPTELLESVFSGFAGMEHSRQKPCPFKENGKPSVSF